MSNEKNTVVIVDDSPVVRTLLKHIIESSSDFTVVGQAGDGAEAVELVKRLRPSAVTMDVQMPKMDGPQAIRRIMTECPTPIVLCSVLATEGAPVVLEALEAGAFEFVTKPKNVLAGTGALGLELIDKLRAAMSANRESLAGRVRQDEPPSGGTTPAGLAPLPSPAAPARPVLAGAASRSTARKNGTTPADAAAPSEPESALAQAGTVRQSRGELDAVQTPAFAPAPVDCVVFGASSGGPKALLSILPGIPASFRAAVVVALQDTPPPIIRILSEQFRKLCKLPAAIVQDQQALEPAKIHILAGDSHAMVIRGEPFPRFKLLERETGSDQVPSLNGLMSSVALAYPGRCLGVLLTGLGKDGALGLKKIRQCGGRTIAEDKTSAILFEKPAAAIALEVVDAVLPAPRIVETILQMAGATTQAKPRLP